MPHTAERQNEEDYRARSARRRRERMRAQLLEAVFKVYPRHASQGPAVISDVIDAAQVSRGTFYKYFNSVEEAVEELGRQLAGELAAAFGLMFEDIQNPLQRAAIAFQLYLIKAQMEPHWGAYIRHLNNIEQDNQFLQHLTADMTGGAAAGVFHIASTGAAIDLVTGSMIEGVKRIVDGKADENYIPTLTVMMLRSLGVAEDAAEEAVKMARQHLQVSAFGGDDVQEE